MSKEFLSCELHDQPLVWELPWRCPFTYENTHDALIKLRDEQYPGPEASPHIGPLHTKVFKICNLCVSANSNHPTIQHLRSECKLEKRI